MAARIGNQQHRWMYGGRNCWNKEPFKFRTNTGEPPVVLKGLIEKGWMWAHRLDTMNWMPRAKRWGMLPHSTFECGLTDRGLEVIRERRDDLHRRLEQQRAKEE